MPVSAQQGIPDDAEQIRREFAAGWGITGPSWGVAPWTAAVRGYLLVHGGLVTEAELRISLRLSHRATTIAIRECGRWGLIVAAPPRRVKARGPRVGSARCSPAVVPAGSGDWQGSRGRSRPPPLDKCLRRARLIGARDLACRTQVLMRFVRQFDRPVAFLMRADTQALAHLLEVINRLEDDAHDRLLSTSPPSPISNLPTHSRICIGCHTRCCVARCDTPAVPVPADDRPQA